ncbi:uncharacterized protein LOC119452278 [Dermacentor silvarum]|uniref:uncharacterized protein LOC119452278 n=1 Tax=Dermacentor silvarum TaxID=543639 RepID=UPI0018995F51|nr:uncharacterized protein LOC119452278 [Dermacentor silvarum]
MEKITRISLLALCALLLPTNALQSETELGSSANAASGSRSSTLRWLPGKDTSITRRRCPLGQVFKQCESSTCGEYRCQDLYHFRERVCTADCQSKCFCNWPFFRNNDGRCVPVWKCYTYKHPAWFEKLRSSISGQAAGGQSGNWGASSGANSGSSSSVNGQWSGGYGQVTGQPTGSWVSAPVFQPGGWGGMNGAQAGSWSYGSGQYPGAWGVVTSQYPGSWGAGYGNWGLGNGNWYTVRRQ